MKIIVFLFLGKLPVPLTRSNHYISILLYLYNALWVYALKRGGFLLFEENDEVFRVLASEIYFEYLS